MAITHTYEEVTQIDVGIPGILEDTETFLKGLGNKALSFREMFEKGLDTGAIIWLFAATPKVSDQLKRQFACDCAERVLPIIHEWNLVETRPADAIDAARRFAKGAATEEQMIVAMREACNAANGIDAKDARTEAVIYAIEAAAVASDCEACFAAITADSASWAMELDGFGSRLKERNWQVSHIMKLTEAA